MDECSTYKITTKHDLKRKTIKHLYLLQEKTTKRRIFLIAMAS